VIRGHKIALDPTPEQAGYCRRTCGTARYAYNWGLAEWQRMREAAKKPSMLAIRRRWNAHRKAELPLGAGAIIGAQGHQIGKRQRLMQAGPVCWL
jgi:hypothetical protein